MAKLEKLINGSFDEIVSKIENGIMSGSISASLEGSSDFMGQNSRCSVRVFERYSYSGGNRLSLNVTLYQEFEKPIQLTAITAGGSNGMFLKFNTFGEEAFLDKLKEIV